MNEIKILSASMLNLRVKSYKDSHPKRSTLCLIGFLRGVVVIPLMFPKVPQSFLGILRIPQLPPPLGHPP